MKHTRRAVIRGSLVGALGPVAGCSSNSGDEFRTYDYEITISERLCKKQSSASLTRNGEEFTIRGSIQTPDIDSNLELSTYLSDGPPEFIAEIQTHGDDTPTGCSGAIKYESRFKTNRSITRARVVHISAEARLVLNKEL